MLLEMRRNMIFANILLLKTLFLSLLEVEASVGLKKYIKVEKSVPALTLSTDKSLSSDIHCAIDCKVTANCRAFDFDESSAKCTHITVDESYNATPSDTKTKVWIDATPAPKYRFLLYPQTSTILDVLTADGQVCTTHGIPVYPNANSMTRYLTVDGYKVYASGGLGKKYLYSIDFSQPSGSWQWTALNEMAGGRQAHGFVHYNGKLYVFGGRVSLTLDVDTIEIYDIASNTWSTSPLTVNEVGGHSAVVVEDEIWVFSCYGHVEVWDPATDTWKVDAANPTAFRSISTSAFLSHQSHYITLLDGRKGILIVHSSTSTPIVFLDMANKGAGFIKLSTIISLKFQGYCSTNLGPGHLTFVGGSASSLPDTGTTRWYNWNEETFVMEHPTSGYVLDREPPNAGCTYIEPTYLSGCF